MHPILKRYIYIPKDQGHKVAHSYTVDQPPTILQVYPRLLGEDLSYIPFDIDGAFHER